MDKGNRPPDEPAASPSATGPVATEPKEAPKREVPDATNSWARRTILSRSEQIGLPPELARQVGSVAIWYYNRIVLTIKKKETVGQELPYGLNRYLVPVTLALACEHKHHQVELDRMMRLSGSPTKKTVATAYQLLARYRPMIATAGPSGTSPRAGRPGALSTSPAAVRPPVSPAPSTRLPPAGRAAAATPLRAGPKPVSAKAPKAVTTALAAPVDGEVLELRRLFGVAPGATPPPRPTPKPKQQSTNAWARKRIADLCRSLGIPDRVRNRALGFYENIVDLHTAKGHAPPGKRLQLSPRLNWSLVYTTIYLACRFEEYPKDLREILGRNPRQGSLREMYGLYRFYKRELGLTINLVDVKTFILSWFDGFEMTELIHDTAVATESGSIKKRAIAVAARARGARSLRTTSTKIIAAGALTTALAESSPPGNRVAFYRAVAAFLHMSEGTLRFIVARIAEIL